MRKTLLLLLPLFLLFSCNDGEEYENWVKISSSNTNVLVSDDGSSATARQTPQGGVIEINVTSNMTNLSLDNNAEGWLGASLSADNVLTLTIPEMQDQDKKIGVVGIMHQGRTYAWVTVVQMPDSSGKTVLTVDKPQVFIHSDGGSETVTVFTNQPSWQIENISDDRVIVNIDGNELDISIEENIYEEPIDATITVAAGEGPNKDIATINVYQDSKSMVLEYTIPEGGGYIRIPLLGEVDCYVEWGDTNTSRLKDTYVQLFNPAPEHHYKTGGVYYVKVTGSVQRLYSHVDHEDLNKSYLTGVIQWGDLGLQSMEYAFSKCVNLSKLPKYSNDAFLEVTSIRFAFADCIGLETLPDGMFKNAIKLTDLFFAFSHCSNLRTIPEDMFEGCLNITAFDNTFGYSGLEEIPEGLFKHCPNVTDLSDCFTSNTKLRTIPENLLSDLPKLTDVSSLFRGCESLMYIPENLFANNPNITAVNHAFAECISLTTVPAKLFANNPEITTTLAVFWRCRSLKSVPHTIFDNNLKIRTFTTTFGDCISADINHICFNLHPMR